MNYINFFYFDDSETQTPKSKNKNNSKNIWKLMAGFNLDIHFEILWMFWISIDRVFWILLAVFDGYTVHLIIHNTAKNCQNIQIVVFLFACVDNSLIFMSSNNDTRFNMWKMQKSVTSRLNIVHCYNHLMFFAENPNTKKNVKQLQ